MMQNSCPNYHVIFELAVLLKRILKHLFNIVWFILKCCSYYKIQLCEIINIDICNY